jgi:hypothetical protein
VVAICRTGNQHFSLFRGECKGMHCNSMVARRIQQDFLRVAEAGVMAAIWNRIALIVPVNRSCSGKRSLGSCNGIVIVFYRRAVLNGSTAVHAYCRPAL